MNLTEQIIVALAKPKRYKDLLKLSKKRFVYFIILLTMLMSVITFVIPAVATIVGFGGFKNLFETNLKTIEYKDGKVSLDNVFKMKINGTTIIVDTSAKEVPFKQMRNTGTYVAVSSDNVSVYSSVSGNVMKVVSYKLTDLFPIDMNKETLIMLIPAIYMYLVLSFLMKTIFYFMEYALYGLFLAVVLNLMKKNHSYNMKFGSIFVICFYAQTLMMLVDSINSSVGLAPSFIISFVGLFYTVRMATIGVLSTTEISE